MEDSTYKESIHCKSEPGGGEGWGWLFLGGNALLRVAKRMKPQIIFHAKKCFLGLYPSSDLRWSKCLPFIQTNRKMHILAY